MSVSKRKLDLIQKELDLKFKEGYIIRFNSSISINSLGDLIYYLCKFDYCTYFLNNTTHCDTSKRRSPDDAYLLCKYYKIDISLKDLDKLFYNISNERFNNYNNDNWILSRLYCWETRKHTHVLRNFSATKSQVNEYLDKLKWNIFVKVKEI